MYGRFQSQVFKSNAELVGIYLGMFVKEGLVTNNAALNKLVEYTMVIVDNHLDNPYHSALHGIDVAYMAYCLLTEMGILEQTFISKLDIAALLLAAIGHDVLHPGRNNNFQV